LFILLLFSAQATSYSYTLSLHYALPIFHNVKITLLELVFYILYKVKSILCGRGFHYFFCSNSFLEYSSNAKAKIADFVNPFSLANFSNSSICLSVRLICNLVFLGKSTPLFSIFLSVPLR